MTTAIPIIIPTIPHSSSVDSAVASMATDL